MYLNFWHAPSIWMMETTDMRSLSREARHERRVQVIRLRKAGQTYERIAEQTGLSRPRRVRHLQPALA